MMGVFHNKVFQKSPLHREERSIERESWKFYLERFCHKAFSCWPQRSSTLFSHAGTCFHVPARLYIVLLGRGQQLKAKFWTCV